MGQARNAINITKSSLGWLAQSRLGKVAIGAGAGLGIRDTFKNYNQDGLMGGSVDTVGTASEVAGAGLLGTAAIGTATGGKFLKSSVDKITQVDIRGPSETIRVAKPISILEKISEKIKDPKSNIGRGINWAEKKLQINEGPTKWAGKTGEFLDKGTKKFNNFLAETKIFKGKGGAMGVAAAGIALLIGGKMMSRDSER